MIILKAIGNFFVKVWRWIKETAWIQPLLIVGGIFAIIFSIPYITDWVGSWGYGSTGAYFNSKLQSLEGEKEEAVKGKDGDYVTEADKIVYDIYENTKLAYDGNYDQINSEYGEKFFLVFTSDDCDGCSKAEEGFKALFDTDNWGKLLVAEDYASFKDPTNLIYTINASEASTNDENYKDTQNSKAFYRFLERNLSFFNMTGYYLENSAPYKINRSVGETNYNHYSTPDFEDFVTPTILLVDYTEAARAQNRAGVSEVIFGVSGDTELDKARLLLQMWDHTTSRTDNPFSANYVA